MANSSSTTPRSPRLHTSSCWRVTSALAPDIAFLLPFPGPLHRCVEDPGTLPRDRLEAYSKGAVREATRTTGSDRLVIKVVAHSVTHLDEVAEQLRRFGTPTMAIVLSSRRSAVGPVPSRERRSGH